VGKGARTLHGGRNGGSAPQCAGGTPNVAKVPAFCVSSVVYDAAVLVAADRNERRTWVKHKARLESGVVPLVPALVVAQVSRSPQQAQLRRFLAACLVVPLEESGAHQAGRLLGIARAADIVDAVVVTTALRHDAMILTGNRDDIARLVRASGVEVAVVAV
jgi:predicted nucleic acid-binding protein